MVEIKHKITGEVLRIINAETLCEADLSEAYLRGADLRGADLRGAYLRGADLSEASLPTELEEGLLLKVAKAALEPCALNMENWHTCGTTHCIAGWACVLTQNKEIEETHGTQIAGLLLLGAEAHSHFFDTNEEAKKYLESVLKTEKE
jgi:uncharacterized protein YjbI with pentapeptide repeats